MKPDAADAVLMLIHAKKCREHITLQAEANNFAHDDDASDAPMGQADNEPQADSDVNGAAAASAATPGKDLVLTTAIDPGAFRRPERQ